MASGISPYSTKVKNAPSKVPCVDVASAKAIRTTTNIQAIGTMCISDGGT